jgi:hypothetical protein
MSDGLKRKNQIQAKKRSRCLAMLPSLKKFGRNAAERIPLHAYFLVFHEQQTKKSTKNQLLRCFLMVEARGDFPCRPHNRLYAIAALGYKQHAGAVCLTPSAPRPYRTGIQFHSTQQNKKPTREG